MSADGESRSRPAATADEHDTLTGYLDYQRATMRWKLDGLSDADASRSLLASPLMTLAGLLKHLIDVEQSWFQEVFAGHPAADSDWDDDDPDATWRIGPADTVETLLRRYDVACAESRAAVAGLEMSAVGHRGTQEFSVRWVIVHMIEETARHAGHADLIREMIDGRTGE